MEAPPSAKSYRHAPDRTFLRVPILGLRRHQPPHEPETRRDDLPMPRSRFWDAVLDKLWFLADLVLLGRAMLALVFFVGYGLICIANARPLALLQFLLVPVGIVTVPLVIAILIARPKYSVLELDSSGIHLLAAGGSSTRFVPYAALRSVRTYLDEGVLGGTCQGAIFHVHGGQTVTLELGANTAKVVEAIDHHRQGVARNTRVDLELASVRTHHSGKFTNV